MLSENQHTFKTWIKLSNGDVQDFYSHQEQKQKYVSL